MASAKELAAQRREQLFSDKILEIPLNGYQDLYRVRYRALGYEEITAARDKAAKKYPNVGDTERELIAFADLLIHACVEIDDVSGPEPEGTGYAWTPDAARDLFGAELPTTATARQAIRAVLPSLNLRIHFQSYDEQLTEVQLHVNEDAEGESEAASAA